MVHHHQMNQPQSFGDFGHGYYSQRPYTQVNLPFSYYRSNKGTSSSLPRYRRRGITTCERPSSSFARQTKWKKHKLCLSIHQPHLHVNPKGTTSLQSTTDDNGTPATWTLVLFQQAIDPQDRTQVEGRFNYWNHWRYNLHRNPPTTGQGLIVPAMTCLVGHQIPLRLLLLLQERRPTAVRNQHLAGDRLLRIAHLDTDICPGPTPSPKYWTLKLTPTPIHRLKHLPSAADALNGNTQRSGIFLTPTTIHVQPSTCKPMRSTWQPYC